MLRRKLRRKVAEAPRMWLRETGIDIPHPHAVTAPLMFSELDAVAVLMARLLPSPRFGMRVEPGGHQALLGAHRVCWCGGSAPVQLPEL